jgi:hypothetical protein
MIVALVALFLALGGVGYAALKIGTNDIKNGAVTSKKVKNNSLTGKDIRESTLGRVPSAHRANQADRAAHADTAATANAANTAVSTSDPNEIPMPDGLATAGNPIKTLTVPAGKYVVIAKLEAKNVGNAPSPNDQCTLRAGSDVDTMEFDVDNANLDDEEAVPLQLVHDFGGGGDVGLRCTDSGAGAVRAKNISITAIQVLELNP